MQAKLPTYALTPLALQALLHTPDLPSSVPAVWFDWVGARGRHGFAAKRLTLVEDPPEVLRWNENAVSAGYAPVLVLASDDAAMFHRCKGLDSQTGLSMVIGGTAGAHDRAHTLNLLREPEPGVSGAWVDAMFGGRGGATGFDEATPLQWCAYGLGLRDWIRVTAGEAGRSIRKVTPDFSTWRLRRSEPAASLVVAHTWDFEHPVVATREVLLPEAVRAFWPTRQLPCCGVVLQQSGALDCIGALPADWSWDTTGKVRGMIKQQVARLTGQRQSGRAPRLLRFERSTLNTVAAPAHVSKSAPPALASAPSIIEWMDEPDGALLEVKLTARGDRVLLQIEVAGEGEPTAIRWLANDREWPLRAAADHWIAEGLTQAEVENVILWFCSREDRDEQFADHGFQIVWSGG